MPEIIHMNDYGSTEGLVELKQIIKLIITFYGMERRSIPFTFRHSKAWEDINPEELVALVKTLKKYGNIFDGKLAGLAGIKQRFDILGTTPLQFTMLQEKYEEEEEEED